MTAQEMSDKIRSGESFPPGTWRSLVDSLSDEQKERIRAKCSWERCSWMAVLADWPSLFEHDEEGQP